MMKFPVLGGRPLDCASPKVMGILNVTPDSFFDGGMYLSEVNIINRVKQMVDEGVDIIDIGACSTRPGSVGVSEKEELARLDPAVELVRRHYPHMPVSIDTYRAKVAEDINGCFGPVIINDISGGTMDGKMFDTVVRLGVPYVLSHIQGTPPTMQQNPSYADVVAEVREFLQERVCRLKAMGFDNLIIDPGFGFGKRLEDNFRLLGALDVFMDFGYPILAGISRKGMVWKTLGCTPDEALNGTTVLNTVALMNGASLLRVHDVRAAVEAVRLVGQIPDREKKTQPL